MFVLRSNKQEISNHKNNIINFDLLNKNSIESLKKKNILFECGRTITIFDNSTILDKTSLCEDYVLLENRVLFPNTPMSYNFYYENIKHSFMYSLFLFVKPRNKEYDLNNELYLLYGFSTGYGEFLKNNTYLDYGFSILDMINNYNNEGGNLTYKFQKYSNFDDQCEFFGPIFPNIYTESQYEFMFNRKYNRYFNSLNETYYLKDLCDENTKVERTKFSTIYYNELETDSDFFSSSSFEKICFLLIIYHINSINIIYHTKKGINCKNIIREYNFNFDKNNKEICDFLNEIKIEIEKIVKFHKIHLKNADMDFLIMISCNSFSYNIEIETIPIKHRLKITISKAEMIERIFQRFTLNTGLISDIINDKNRDIMHKQYISGYQDSDELDKDTRNYYTKNKVQKNMSNIYNLTKI